MGFSLLLDRPMHVIISDAAHGSRLGRTMANWQKWMAASYLLFVCLECMMRRAALFLFSAKMPAGMPGPDCCLTSRSGGSGASIGRHTPLRSIPIPHRRRIFRRPCTCRRPVRSPPRPRPGDGDRQPHDPSVCPRFIWQSLALASQGSMEALAGGSCMSGRVSVADSLVQLLESRRVETFQI